MIEIIEAYYNTLNVTEKLKNLIKNNKTPIVANNITFGESQVGVPKIMRIKYTENGTNKYLEVNENMIISFHIPIFEFIIPTYNRIRPLYLMLSSLAVQSKNNWKATIVVDDVENNRIKEIVNKIDCDKINYMFLDKRYNDWGHTPRNIGKQASTSDYIILTGDDNYYVPSFIEELNQAVAIDKFGLIYWDMLHNGYGYNHFVTTLDVGCIDMGAFVTRRDLAQQIQLNTKLLTADSTFVLDFQKKFPHEKTHKINKILFVHN